MSEKTKLITALQKAFQAARDLVAAEQELLQSRSRQARRKTSAKSKKGKCQDATPKSKS